MKGQTEKKIYWWQTLPWILTAIGSLIVAVTGLIGVLYQSGLITIGKTSPAQTDKQVVEKPKPIELKQSETTKLSLESSVQKSPSTTPSPVTSIDVLKPITEAFAIITNTAGGQVSVRASTLFVGPDQETKGFQLSNGQTVNFEKIRSVEFLGVERTREFRNYEANAGLPKVRITLWNGQAITSAIQIPFGWAAGLPHFFISGSSDLGDFNIRPWEVKEIRFER